MKSNQAGDTFYVESKVKAKNEFGAQLTYRWQTIVFFDGGTLQLVSCAIDGKIVYESKELLKKITERRAPSTPPATLDEQNELAIDAQRDAAVEAAKWRTWTTANGKFKVEAKFVKFGAGTLTLEKKDGTTVDVKLDKLCLEDQDFVRKRKWTRPAGDVNSDSTDNTRLDASGSGPSAKIVKARLVPFTTADGVQTQMVLVDWKNTGATTIRAVDADIIVYDAHGNILESGEKNKPIYAVSDSDPGIAPGETYVETVDKGFILAPGLAKLGFAKAARVQVKIIEVVESGAY